MNIKKNIVPNIQRQVVIKSKKSTKLRDVVEVLLLKCCGVVVVGLKVSIWPKSVRLIWRTNHHRKKEINIFGSIPFNAVQPDRPAMRILSDRSRDRSELLE